MKYDLINFIEIDFIYLNLSPLQSILFGDLINQCPTHPNKIRLCKNHHPMKTNHLSGRFPSSETGMVLFGFTPKSAGSSSLSLSNSWLFFRGVPTPCSDPNHLKLVKIKKRRVWKVPYMKLVHFRGVHHEIPWNPMKSHEVPWNPIGFMVKHPVNPWSRTRGPDDAHLDIF